MAEVVLDANVIVGHLYAADAQHDRAEKLLDRLERQGDQIVLLDVLVQEAVSVLCRRAAERKTAPPDLKVTLDIVRRWYDEREIRFVAREAERLAGEVLEVIFENGGALNFNDAFVVVLQREGTIDGLATFDAAFAGVAGFRQVS